MAIRSPSRFTEAPTASAPSVVPTLVPKGSITVAGASLTINTVDGDRFGVTLIPHTLAVTTLGELAVGASVNLEGDLIAKHVDRLVTARLERPVATGEERKRNHG